MRLGLDWVLKSELSWSLSRVIYTRLFRIGRARKNEILADLVQVEGPVNFNITRNLFWLQMIHYTAAKEGIPLGMPELQTSRDEHWCTFQGFSETDTFRHMSLHDETIIFKHFLPNLLASNDSASTFHAPDRHPLPNVVYVLGSS